MRKSDISAYLVLSFNVIRQVPRLNNSKNEIGYFCSLSINMVLSVEA